MNGKPFFSKESTVSRRPERRFTSWAMVPKIYGGRDDRWKLRHHDRGGGGGVCEPGGLLKVVVNGDDGS